MKLNDVTVDGTKDGSISLSKLVGSKVVDIIGYLSNEFGEVTFVMSRAVLEDGRELFLGGEHDMPYVEADMGVSDEELEKLYREVNGSDDESDGDED